MSNIDRRKTYNNSEIPANEGQIMLAYYSGSDATVDNQLKFSKDGGNSWINIGSGSADHIDSQNLGTFMCRCFTPSGSHLINTFTPLTIVNLADWENAGHPTYNNDIFKQPDPGWGAPTFSQASISDDFKTLYALNGHVYKYNVTHESPFPIALDEHINNANTTGVTQSDIVIESSPDGNDMVFSYIDINNDWNSYVYFSQAEDDENGGEATSIGSLKLNKNENYIYWSDKYGNYDQIYRVYSFKYFHDGYHALMAAHIYASADGDIYDNYITSLFLVTLSSDEGIKFIKRYSCSGIPSFRYESNLNYYYCCGFNTHVLVRSRYRNEIIYSNGNSIMSISEDNNWEETTLFYLHSVESNRYLSASSDLKVLNTQYYISFDYGRTWELKSNLGLDNMNIITN